MGNPSLQLAERVLNRLVDEKLLMPDDRKKLLSALAEGRMRSEDWRLAIELASQKGKDK